MRFEGSLTIRAPRDRVWGFLTDPEAVSQCAPGLESLEIVVPRQRFRAVAAVGFGSVKATFVTDAEWLDLEAPQRARMKVHGTAPGSAMDATSEMLLSDGPEGTTAMTWRADVTIAGTIASVAARLMSGVAQRLTDAFFDAVRRRIEARRELWFGPIPLDQAEGKLLGHDVAGADGRPALRKGRPLTAADVALLREMGRSVVYVAEPGSEDVDEDSAARRVAQAALGDGLALGGTAAGRVNLLSTVLGVLRVDPARLARLNGCEGVTLATLAAHSAVRAGQAVATVKVIPFAVPEPTVRQAAQVAGEGGPLLRVDALASRAVGLVLTGPPPARDRMLRDLDAPLRERIEALGSALQLVDFVPLEEEAGEAALAEALERQRAAGAGLIVLSGETAIVDRHDIAPRAIERARGELACFGAPVDPGSLLLLAYLGEVPVLGASAGCVRSPKPNVIDQVLPRLLAGERLTRADIAALGHGGLREGQMARDTQA